MSTPKTIKLEDLNTIKGFQEKCKDDAPVTTRATFRLSELEELIKKIRERISELRPGLITKGGKIDLAKESKCHTVCITFVREKIIADCKLETWYSRINDTQLLLENSTEKNRGEYYTQIIPIISGCIADLDEKYHNKKFKYLFDDESENSIPFIHPGGEGTGLIPPPPPGK
jgi:hypothetical protein